MKHLTYFCWTELNVGDRFRIAGYDDLFVKTSDRQALCLASNGLARHRLSKRGEHVEFAPNVGGLILSI